MEAAAADLRSMRVLRAVIASVISEKNEGAYRALERDLIKAMWPDAPGDARDPRAAVAGLARRLRRARQGEEEV